MPTWLVPESALQTLLILSRMKNGARIDELKTLSRPTPTSDSLDRMAARGWATTEGKFGQQRRFRITPLGLDAISYGRAERAAR